MKGGRERPKLQLFGQRHLYPLYGLILLELQLLPVLLVHDNWGIVEHWRNGPLAEMISQLRTRDVSMLEAEEVAQSRPPGAIASSGLWRVEELREGEKRAAWNQPPGHDNVLMGINEFLEGPGNTPEVDYVSKVGVAADCDYQFSRQAPEI